ncbi:MAG: hypothetical protein ABIK83_05435 [Candidatus Zixiibacteriota bacterium]
MRASGYKLGIQCCFCGGSLEIDEASRTTVCSHCASVMKIVRRKGTAKYYIPDDLERREAKFLIESHLKKISEPLVSSWGNITRIFLPFWRVAGTVFAIDDRPAGQGHSEYSNLTQDEVDDTPRTELKISPRETSFCANDSLLWGVDSLGIRTQVLKLVALDRDACESNALMPLTVTEEDARLHFDKAVTSLSHTAARLDSTVETIAVGVKQSLIYFPMWIASFTNAHGNQTVQFDPLAKRVVSLNGGEIDIPAPDVSACDATLSVEIAPHRCPNCGVDLPANQTSVAYYCENCEKMFVGDGSAYRNIALDVPSDLDEHAQLFPFWVFDLADAAWPEKGELLRALNLVQFSSERFFVPAFNISHPARMMRLASHFNRRNDSFLFAERKGEHYTFADVTLSPDVAAEMIVPLTIATKAAKGFKLYEAPVSGTPAVAEPKLIWLPFVLDRYFWIEQITGAAIEKAAVRI